MPYKYTDDMQIDLSNLLKNPNGSYDWKGSIGAICKFNYKGIEGEVILKGYSSDRKVTISYQGNDYTLLAIPFKKGNLSCLFQQRVYEYRWNIGDIIHLSKQDLEVLEQLRSNRGERKYKLKCLTCKNIFESCELDILKGRGKQLNLETLNKLLDYINNNPNVTRNDIMNYMGFGKSLYQKYMSSLENKPTWYHMGRPKVEERSFVWQKS